MLGFSITTLFCFSSVHSERMTSEECLLHPWIKVRKGLRGDKGMRKGQRVEELEYSVQCSTVISIELSTFLSFHNSATYTEGEGQQKSLINQHEEL